MRSSRRAFLSTSALGLATTLPGCASVEHAVLGARPRVDFHESVPAADRDRFRRAADRTRELVPASLDDPVRVAYVPPRRNDNDDDDNDDVENDDGDDGGDGGDAPPFDPRRFHAGASRAFVREVRRSQHVTDALADSPLVAASRLLHAQYDHGSRTISFVDPSDPTARSGLEALRESGLVDDASARTGDLASWFPPTAAFVHELTHAIQRDRFDVVPAVDETADARRARTAIVEGTADYVEGQYRASCQRDRPSSCVESPVDRAVVRRAPALVATGRQAYVDGRAFVARLERRSGWDGIWRVHESPPATMAAVAYADREHAKESETTTVPLPETGREWVRIGTDRLGVTGLYTKLFALGLTSLQEPAAALPASTTTATTYAVAYRSRLCAAWIGDRFSAYAHVDDPSHVGHRWRVRFGTATAAREFAHAIASAYDDRGEPRDRGWALDDRLAGVSRRARDVTLWMAPDDRALNELAPSPAR